MIYYLLIFLFSLLSGACKGISDAYMFERTDDWQNKYRKQDGLLVPLPKKQKAPAFKWSFNWFGNWFSVFFHNLYLKYHIEYGLSYQERFFLSGTLLVGFTDGFHRFNSLRQMSILIAVIIAMLPQTETPQNMVLFGICYTVTYMGGFFFSHQFTRKRLRNGK